jgi:hypothetical protein
MMNKAPRIRFLAIETASRDQDGRFAITRNVYNLRGIYKAALRKAVFAIESRICRGPVYVKQDRRTTHLDIPDRIDESTHQVRTQRAVIVVNSSDLIAYFHLCSRFSSLEWTKMPITTAHPAEMPAATAAFPMLPDNASSIARANPRETPIAVAAHATLDDRDLISPPFYVTLNTAILDMQV